MAAARSLILVVLVTFLRISLQTVQQPDLSHIVFPPVFKPSDDPNIRAGHLKPFGFQRPPNGHVLEYSRVLKPQEFWDKHVSQNLPLVFRGGIAESPAIKRWTDEYLKEKYGDLDVLIEGKKENRTHGKTQRISLESFIDTYRKDDLYVVTVMPDPMREEVQVPPCILCGTFAHFLHETNLWIGSGGTRSVIHYDADHNIHCMVAGRKDFIMIHQKFKKQLLLGKFPQFGSGFSMLDPDIINLDTYPDIPEVEWTYATINAGDCIFLPSGYIHQVRSYARSISATMLFTASVDNTFEPIGCENQTFEYTPLSKVRVHWTYNKGDKAIPMGYQNVENFRHNIMKEMREQNVKEMTAGTFNEFIESSFDLEPDDLQTLKRDPQKLFAKYLDVQKKGFLTIEDVKKVPFDNLKAIAMLCEAPHGPVVGELADPDERSEVKEDDEEEEEDIEERIRKYREKFHYEL